MIFAKTLDGSGIYGSLFHFAFAGAFFGGALLVFFYLWRKGCLDMDESPAKHMLEDDHEESNDGQ